MKLEVNGKITDCTADCSLVALLEQLSIDPTRQGIAIALNDAVVPRSEWSGTTLGGGDRVEIVTAVSGG